MEKLKESCRDCDYSELYIGAEEGLRCKRTGIFIETYRCEPPHWCPIKRFQELEQRDTAREVKIIPSINFPADMFYVLCPGCEAMVAVRERGDIASHGLKFCRNCGQRLLWESEDEW